MELKVFNLSGAAVGTVNVSDTLFNAEYNEDLIHQVVVAQLANKRQGTKSSLTMGEVQGSTRKPWRQKGTGRARQGSIRAPQWRHGGVVFAPKPRDFSKKLNKGMKKQALASALSQKIRQEELVVLDAVSISAGKTRLMAQVCDKLSAGHNALFVLSGKSENNENVVRATRNLAEADVCEAGLVNVYDLVRSGKVFITKDAVTALEEANA